jgi:NAD(P)-dependent dehydrogenase (short-subunit alcohol dehydrogenase family)
MTPVGLNGKVVAISGAARGIGRATATACLRAGMRVAIGDLDEAAANAAAAELGGGTVAVELDVTDRSSFAAFLDSVEDQLGKIDVVINNAGIMRLGAFADEADETTRGQVEVNAIGVLNGMKEAIARMAPRGQGHIVNVASTAGKGGFAGAVTYCATKHFVVGATEAARSELAGTGIELSCVMPGVVNTELSSGLQPARGVKNSEPEEVARAIVEALRNRRFDVYVPRAVGWIGPVIGLLPRGARDQVSRALRADRLLADADPAVRASYEARAAASAPPRVSH